MTILTAACLGSIIPYWLYHQWWTWAILIGSALFDGLLYLWVGDVGQDHIEEVDPHPEIVQMRKRLNFDYGKFDYVVHNGRAVLFDANKTTGADRVTTPRLNARRRHRADGIYSYFA